MNFKSFLLESFDKTLYDVDDFIFTELEPGLVRIKLPKASGSPQFIMTKFFMIADKEDHKIKGIYDLLSWKAKKVRGPKYEVVSVTYEFDARKEYKLKITRKPKTAYIIHAPGEDVESVKRTLGRAITMFEKSLEDFDSYNERQKASAEASKKSEYEKRKIAQKKLRDTYGKDLLDRVKTRKYQGDDAYSWAVFVDGYPIITGLSSTSAAYEKTNTLKRLLKKKNESK